MSFKERINQVGAHLKKHQDKYLPGALALGGALAGAGASEALDRKDTYEQDSIDDLKHLNDQATDKGVNALFKTSGADKYIDATHNYKHSLVFDDEDKLREMQKNPNFGDERQVKQGIFGSLFNPNSETQKEMRNSSNETKDFIKNNISNPVKDTVWNLGHDEKINTPDVNTPKEQVQYRNDGLMNINGTKIDASGNLDNGRLDLAKQNIHDQYKAAAGDKLDPITNRILGRKDFQDKIIQYGEDYKNADYNANRDSALQGLAAGGTIAAGLALNKKRKENQGK